MLYAVSGRAACVYLPESCDSVLYAVSGRCLYVHLPESCDSVLYAVSGRAACPCVHFARELRGFTPCQVALPVYTYVRVPVSSNTPVSDSVN